MRREPLRPKPHWLGSGVGRERRGQKAEGFRRSMQGKGAAGHRTRHNCRRYGSYAIAHTRFKQAKGA